MPKLSRLLAAWIVCLAAVAGCQAAPVPPPPASTASGPATRPDDSPHRLAQLTRRAITLSRQQRLDQAEVVLEEALALDPAHPTNLYNMACVQALKNRPDAAMDYLERSVDAGFTDFLFLDRDPDLAGLRSLPRYTELLARKEHHLRQVADRVVEVLRSSSAIATSTRSILTASSCLPPTPTPRPWPP